MDGMSLLLNLDLGLLDLGLLLTTISLIMRWKNDFGQKMGPCGFYAYATDIAKLNANKSAKCAHPMLARRHKKIK